MLLMKLLIMIFKKTFKKSSVQGICRRFCKNKIYSSLYFIIVLREFIWEIEKAEL